METINASYTRKVSGETFDYELEYTPGDEVQWLARVFHEGRSRGEPRGSLTANELQGEALRAYLVDYVENMIERGLDVAE